MNKLLIIIILLGCNILAKAQTQDEMKKAWLANAKTMEEMRSGKYIRNDGVNEFIGKWITYEKGKEIELLITTKKTHIKGRELNYYTDAIYVEIKKCIYLGEDMAKKIKEPIMLTGDSFKYVSTFLKDPISGDDIKFRLYNLNNDGSLKLNVNTMYSPGTSTIFPLGNTILKRKK